MPMYFESQSYKIIISIYVSIAEFKIPIGVGTNFGHMGAVQPYLTEPQTASEGFTMSK